MEKELHEVRGSYEELKSDEKANFDSKKFEGILFRSALSDHAVFLHVLGRADRAVRKKADLSPLCGVC